MKKGLVYSLLLSLSLVTLGAQAQNLFDNSEANKDRQLKSRDHIWKLEYDNTVTNGLHALKRQEYERAFNLLSEAANWGSKEAQFYVSQMYFNGWHVEPDYQIGWLWMSVALEQRNAEWATAYNRVKNALPEEFIEAMKPLVAEHIAEYGADAKDLNCRHRAQTGSNIRQTICEKQFY